MCIIESSQTICSLFVHILLNFLILCPGRKYLHVRLRHHGWDTQQHYQGYTSVHCCSTLSPVPTPRWRPHTYCYTGNSCIHRPHAHRPVLKYWMSTTCCRCILTELKLYFKNKIKWKHETVECKSDLESLNVNLIKLHKTRRYLTLEIFMKISENWS